MSNFPVLLGALSGVLVIVTVIPALIGGLFRRKTAPSTQWIVAAWAIALFLAFSGIYGGTNWVFSAVSIAILGILTALRITAWKRRVLDQR